MTKPKSVWCELVRFSMLEIVEYPTANLMVMLVGKNVINNPNAIRYDDVIAGDIVFYEPKPKARN